jgi:hypothetical protein
MKILVKEYRDGMRRKCYSCPESCGRDALVETIEVRGRDWSGAFPHLCNKMFASLGLSII